MWIQQAVRSGRIDLRKILGDRNPADLLTKHSLSRGRLEMLVGVFGCQLIDGRVAAAPLLRRGDAAKQTIAEADSDLDVVLLESSMVAAAGPSGPAPPTTEKSMVALSSHSATASPTTNVVHDLGTPVIMPHISLSETELDAKYPRLKAPEEVLSADPTDDSRDVVLQHGLKIARQIQQHAIDYGRLRHTEEATEKARTTATTTATRTRATPSTASTARATGTASTTTTPSARASNFEATAVASVTGRSSAGGVLRYSTDSRIFQSLFRLPSCLIANI